MNLTVESVKQATSLQIEFAFSIPQSILQFTIGFIITGDLPTNKSILDDKYDTIGNMMGQTVLIQHM